MGRFNFRPPTSVDQLKASDSTAFVIGGKYNSPKVSVTDYP